ncbi:hypothetical protein BX616_007166 [Lobosporangium transversale]|uniref:Uncharacterized protein n=1 Tax=Lobosporangium transversale TaxID=64571 RepID=A0A1Y2G7C3_9FUNG|nr:hypothetical protein BCR41DRAFT_390359 [Lobosporangium transversale]KAF9914976.1 hypothetical protein BX616_007166 [Lobosporangium transversale]ORY99786.1 hypothetical protein BCR41DRAFT_390359 [Lobosporangium transversale]|eukprot:XP_021876020.1 hypothetical protein BCR41DRAFT_390359 [Lobosporangium transversale]
MLFTRASATIYTTVLVAIALLVTIPLMTEAADCTVDCAPINARIVFCGNVRDGLQDNMPAIGIDPRLDDCLCTEDNLQLYTRCLACKDLNNAGNLKKKFISDCRVNDPNRDLGDVGDNTNNAPSYSSSSSNVALTFVSVAIAIALGL